MSRQPASQQLRKNLQFHKPEQPKFLRELLVKHGHIPAGGDGALDGDVGTFQERHERALQAKFAPDEPRDSEPAGPGPATASAPKTTAVVDPARPMVFKPRRTGGPAKRAQPQRGSAAPSAASAGQPAARRSKPPLLSFDADE